MILVIDNSDPIDKAFNQPLADAISSLADCEVVHYDDIPPAATLSGRYEAVIISGVPLHYPFESVENRLPYFQWLTDADLPVLGVCLGHQILGKLHGSAVIRDTEAEDGIVPVRATVGDPIFSGLPGPANIRMYHRASITVPDSFILLGSTADCRNAMMKHADKPLYGFQFHPELNEDGYALLRNFLTIARNFVAQQESRIAAV